MIQNSTCLPLFFVGNIKGPSEGLRGNKGKIETYHDMVNYFNLWDFIRVLFRPKKLMRS